MIIKKKIVLVGIYLTGIYPRGDDTAVAHLLAPAYLKAVTDADPEISKNHETRILNLPSSLDEKEITGHILAEKPDIVGFSIYIWNFDLMYKCSRLVREKDSNLQIIWGGPQVSCNPIEMMEANPQVSIIVSGSGETRFKKLLKSGFEEVKLAQIPGITYRSKTGEIIHNSGNIIEDLTQVPSPYNTGIIDLDVNDRNCVFIETFRGCLFECGFCFWMGEQKKKINHFPIEQVLQDIDIVYNHPNVVAVVFYDACILYTRKRAKLIFDRIASCKKKIPTILTLDIAFINEEMIECLNHIDLSHQKFHFGMQSINQETLKLMNRRIGPKVFEERVSFLKKLDPDAEISFDLIYGLPGDNHDIFRETVDFALNLLPIKLNMSPLVLLPGSPYWARREEFGFDYSTYPPYYVLSNKTYSAEDMKKTRRLVLGLIMVMYFPAIRDTIYEISRENTRLRKIDLFESFIAMFEKRSNIMFDFTDIKDEEQCSPEVQNHIRKKIMNKVAKPDNCLLAYEIMNELLNKHNAKDLEQNVLTGIDYYKRVSNLDLKSTNKSFGQYDRKLLDKIKFGWVISGNGSYK